jgi:hypothetical protein
VEATRIRGRRAVLAACGGGDDGVAPREVGLADDGISRVYGLYDGLRLQIQASLALLSFEMH